MTGKVFFSLRWMCLLYLILCSSCTKKVTLISLLEEMTTRANLSYFPEQSFTHHQFSSYNRKSLSPDKDGWFANADMSHFIRIENNQGRREFVMFDTIGPGAIVRWWMTFYKAQNGVIRIYIDSDSTPVLKGSPNELLSGNLLAGTPLAVSVQAGAVLGEEGRDYDHNLYVPIPFAKHCKITYECDSLVLLYDYEGTPVKEGYYWPDVFYNIGFRAYSKTTSVESFSQKLLMEAKTLLENSGKSLLSNQLNPAIKENFAKLILPGDSLKIEFSQKYYAINRLMLDLDAADMCQALRSTVLKVSFDGYQTVWAPVGEFFGTGYSLNPHKTWMNQRDENGMMESFWIMPFHEKCVLTFVNYGNDTISLKGSAGLTSYKWGITSMYFGSSWHEYYHVNTQDENSSPFDLNFVTITGKGVYVGDQVTLFNNTYKWWGEGDEKIFVDGELFPSSFGTGSEDYYGYSFGRPESFSHPFLSQPEGTGNINWGLTVNMRHRSLDAIPFNTSISSNIELWHWATIKMNYALTTYYYILPPFSTNIIPDVESVKRPVVFLKNDFPGDDK